MTRRAYSQPTRPVWPEAIAVAKRVAAHIGPMNGQSPERIASDLLYGLATPNGPTERAQLRLPVEETR